MRETLRLAPTAFARTVLPTEDTTVLDGKYAVKKGQRIVISSVTVHRDPAVWGEDVSYFHLFRADIDALRLRRPRSSSLSGC